MSLLPTYLRTDLPPPQMPSGVCGAPSPPRAATRRGPHRCNWVGGRYRCPRRVRRRGRRASVSTPSVGSPDSNPTLTPTPTPTRTLALTLTLTPTLILVLTLTRWAALGPRRLPKNSQDVCDRLRRARASAHAQPGAYVCIWVRVRVWVVAPNPNPNPNPLTLTP